MALTTFLPNKHQLGFRLFRGETLNSISNAVNQLGVQGIPVNGALTTVGASTLTAALLLGGLIQRSGSVAAFTDTTDTGAALDTVLGNAAITGTSWEINYFNNVGFSATIAGGTGVTASGNLVVPPNSIGVFLLTRTGTATYTIVGLQADAGLFTASGPVVATADNGTTQTLTAAMVTGGMPTIHTSTGGTTPSLTLPLATAIDTALPNIQTGQSYILRIINLNSGVATVVTNTGWTLSGTLTIPANGWREFVVTRTGAGTYTGVSVGLGTGP